SRPAARSSGRLRPSVASWVVPTRLEVPDRGLAERARARIRHDALYSPPRYRHEVEQLAGEGAEAEAGAEGGEDLRHPLAVDLLAVGGGDPQYEAQLVQCEHGEVGPGDEDGSADDRVLPGERDDQLVAERAA